MLSEDLTSSRAVSANAVPPFLSLRDAVVRRGGHTILSVDKLDIQEKECVALLGPNGSGKSTFVSLITREIFPLYRDDPPVLFRGRSRATLAEVKACLGVVSSTMQHEVRVHLPSVDIVAGGVYGSLGIPLRATGVEKAREKACNALEMLGIAELAKRDVMTLSTGQQRRVLIARALVNDPETLVLDEPCTGLDPEGMYYVRSSMRKLAQAGKGIVLVTHYPEDIVPEISRLILLKEGRVFADGAKEDILQDAVMSELFEVSMQVKCTRVQEQGCGGGEGAGSDAPHECAYFSLVSTY